MAEIIVEPENRDPKKNNSSIWPWILGALLLIGLVWVLVEVVDDDEPEIAAATEVVEREPVANETFEENTMSEEAVVAAPVTEFIQFTENEADMGLNHEYASMGVQKLSAALNALATNFAGDADIEQKLQQFQHNADQIQQNAESLQHANILHQTFVSATDVLTTIKNKNFPDSDIALDELQNAAQDINPQTPTLEQKEKVKAFFEQAGQSIETLSQENVAVVE